MPGVIAKRCAGNRSGPFSIASSVRCATSSKIASSPGRARLVVVAFVDGYKRAGLLAAVVFLDVDGISIAHPSDALYVLTMGVAEGHVEKAAIAAELDRIARTRDEV
jgi:hypothetical protein